MHCLHWLLSGRALSPVCRIWQKYTTLGQDVCLYCKVMDLLSQYPYRLSTRRFIQGKFESLKFEVVSTFHFYFYFIFGEGVNIFCLSWYNKIRGRGNMLECIEYISGWLISVALLLLRTPSPQGAHTHTHTWDGGVRIAAHLHCPPHLKIGIIFTNEEDKGDNS